MDKKAYWSNCLKTVGINLNDNFHFLELKNREERERQYFDTGLPATSSALMNEDVVEDDELYDRVSSHCTKL